MSDSSSEDSSSSSESDYSSRPAGSISSHTVASLKGAPCASSTVPSGPAVLREAHVRAAIAARFRHRQLLAQQSLSCHQQGAVAREQQSLAVPTDPVAGLEPWAVDEAVRHFEQHLLLDAYRPRAPKYDGRAEACTAEFRLLVGAWRPSCKDFWWHCKQFCQEWSWAWTPGSGRKPAGSPRARTVSAGRMTNYLSRLLGSAPPCSLDKPRVDFFAEQEMEFPPEVCVTAKRFGIRLTDIRVTSDSIFEACQDWTGLGWGKDHAADPCPWPTPPGLDGLRCCWQELAAASGHRRIYLNPPWSRLDAWLYKAVCECRSDLPVLACLPGWLDKTICSDMKRFAGMVNSRNVDSAPKNFDIQSKVLCDAQFAHPTTGYKMPPLHVLLIWIRCLN